MKGLLLTMVLSTCAPLATPEPTPSGSPTSSAAPSVSTPPSGSTLPGSEECTADPRVIGRSEFVVERYYQLSNGGSVVAITDCFARVWRDRNPNFAESAQQWGMSGPAFGVVIETLDSVNGCERVRGGAHMRGSAQQTTSYFVIGPESGRIRIYAVQSALATPELESARCQ